MSDYISRNAITQVLNTMDRYVADELTLCDTEKKFPRNEVFVVDDVYEEIIEQLPPADVRENIHGEWYEYDNKYILMDAQRSYIRECMCRKCDGLAYFRISKITGKEIGNNFCPNCGADMRGE